MVSDSKDETVETDQSVEAAAPANAAPAKKVVFTKEPQPELSLADRRKKAGLTGNRIGTYIVVGGFALVMIGIGVVGLLTKSR